MSDSTSLIGVAAHAPDAERRWSFAPGLTAHITRRDGEDLARARLEILRGEAVERSFALSDWFSPHQIAQWRAQAPSLKGMRALLVLHKVLAHPELIGGRGVDLAAFEPVTRNLLSALRRRWFNAFEVRNLSGPGRRCDQCPDTHAGAAVPEGGWRSARDLDCPHAPVGDDALRALSSDAPAMVLELIGLLAVDPTTHRYCLDAGVAQAVLQDVDAVEYPMSLRAITPGSEALPAPEVDDTAPAPKRPRRPRAPRPPRYVPEPVEAEPAPAPPPKPAPRPKAPPPPPAVKAAPRPAPSRSAPPRPPRAATAEPAGPRVFSRAELAQLFTADFLAGLLRAKRVVSIGKGRYQFVR